MSRDFQTISENATIDEVIEILSKSKHSYLLVTNAKGELVGILSFHDVRKALLEKKEKEKIKQEL